MKVLFISSGNSGKISPIVYNQAKSLSEFDSTIEVDFFLIKGKGFKGYLRNIQPLHKHLKSNKYDIIHAHYSLSAFVASFALAKPLVVSLMGSDVKAGYLFRFFIILISLFFRWKKIIVKSEEMKRNLGIPNCFVVPNGVNLEQFKPLNKNECLEKLGWNKEKKHILFAANPNRPEKNYQLAYNAFSLLNNNNIELHFLDNVPNFDIPIYLNAADVVLLTSLWEGSPNIIKEAMACCRPIVSTNVGDVQILFDGLKGCFITHHSVDNCLEKLKLALDYSFEFHQTIGHRRIINLQLNSESVASIIIDFYKEVKSGKNNF